MNKEKLKEKYPDPPILYQKWPHGIPSLHTLCEDYLYYAGQLDEKKQDYIEDLMRIKLKEMEQ